MRLGTLFRRQKKGLAIKLTLCPVLAGGARFEFTTNGLKIDVSNFLTVNLARQYTSTLAEIYIISLHF